MKPGKEAAKRKIGFECELFVAVVGNPATGDVLCTEVLEGMREGCRGLEL